MVKTLVVYFSNSGNTRKVAERLGAHLNADVEEIRERKTRPLLRVLEEGEKPGGLAVIKAAMGGMLGISSCIEDVQCAPELYDLVVIGSPLWAGGLTPAVRSYLKKYCKRMRRVAFFCTGESPEKGRALRQMQKLAHKVPIAVMSVPARDVRSGNIDAYISDLASRLTLA